MGIIFLNRKQTICAKPPALVVIDKLLKAGVVINVFDPIAMDETKRRIGDVVTYCKDMYEAVIDADAIALMTEWKQFRMPSWAIIRKAMKNHVVVDGRNIYDGEELKELGFTYSRIGQNETDISNGWSRFSRLPSM